MAGGAERPLKSALPENLIESELFGHRAGAFTGASERREGAFVHADGGTLFLDELDSLSPAVQARLLRAVEERSVRAVGDDMPDPSTSVSSARRDATCRRWLRMAAFGPTSTIG